MDEEIKLEIVVEQEETDISSDIKIEQFLKGDKGDKGEPGENGVQGIQGEQGTQGFSAYEIAVQNGFVGTVLEWLASLKGPKGDTGGVNSIDGKQGNLVMEELLPKEQYYKEIISEEKSIITLPFWYKVGANMLKVYYNGQLLTKASSLAGEDGHYVEVGQADSWSNQVQCNNGWTWLVGTICQVTGKGVVENEPSAE